MKIKKKMMKKNLANRAKRGADKEISSTETPHAYWLPIRIGYCEADTIHCSKCLYFTSPSVEYFEIGKKKYGRLTLPDKCPYCGSIMMNREVFDNE